MSALIPTIKNLPRPHIARCGWCGSLVAFAYFHTFGMSDEFSAHLATCPTRKFFEKRFRAETPTLFRADERAFKRMQASARRAARRLRRLRALERMHAHKQKIRERRAAKAARERASRRYEKIEA